MNEAMESIYDGYRPPYIGLYLGVISGCLRTSSKKEPKGICLCKQATNVEDSSRTIVTLHAKLLYVKPPYIEPYAELSYAEPP
jgi:hypothetical protein